jgi:hypothetical protein
MWAWVHHGTMAGRKPGQLAGDSSPNFVSRLAAMGRAAVGRVLSLSHRQAISDAKQGVPLSAEHCQAISDAHKGVPLSAEHRQALSAPKMGNTNNSKPVDPARHGVCHCRCGCGPRDSSCWFANGLQCSSCYHKAGRNVKAGRTGVDGKGFPYCAPM